MSDADFYFTIFGMFGVGLVIFGMALIQIRDRQRWHAENEAEERAAKAALTPAE